MQDMIDIHVSVREAAKILGITTRVVNRIVNAGRIDVIKLPGGDLRIPYSQMAIIKDLRGQYDGEKETIEGESGAEEGFEASTDGDGEGYESSGGEI